PARPPHVRLRAASPLDDRSRHAFPEDTFACWRLSPRGRGFAGGGGVVGGDPPHLVRAGLGWCGRLLAVDGVLRHGIVAAFGGAARRGAVVAFLGAFGAPTGYGVGGGSGGCECRRFNSLTFISLG